MAEGERRRATDPCVSCAKLLAMDWQLAELDSARRRLRAPMDDPATKDSADGVDGINALAESPPGLVQR